MKRKSDGRRIIGVGPSEVRRDGGVWVIDWQLTGRHGKFRKGLCVSQLAGPKRNGELIGKGRKPLVGETVLIAVGEERRGSFFVPAAEVVIEDGDPEFTSL